MHRFKCLVHEFYYLEIIPICYLKTSYLLPFGHVKTPFPYFLSSTNDPYV